MAFSQQQFDTIADSLPLGRDPASVRRRIETVEKAMERVWVVPGIRQPVGLDFLIGLIPVVGDIATAGMGAWVVWEARNLGMSKFQIARMAANVGVDTLVGAVPLLGDALDFFFRSNTRNLRIIRKHLDRHHPATVTIDATPIPPARS